MSSLWPAVIDAPNPVAKAILLQELFGEVLEVPFGELDVGSNSDFVVAFNDRWRKYSWQKL